MADFGQALPRSLRVLKAALAAGYWVDPTLGIVYSRRGTPLQPFSTGKGYFAVTMMANGMRAAVPVHKVIAYCVHGEKVFSGTTTHIRHLDSNTSNNQISNLALGTPAENAADVPKYVRSAASKKGWAGMDLFDRQARIEKAGLNSMLAKLRSSHG